ncbi:arylamine N-acetyltransferase family protein [Halobacillus massiliensis]|uniref:arylamine N-acetyltransferase family protein n=1 Tax=Halobacillus massiliensis TaxID=1926286 RepID=UPI0009E53575|nr:arylamine N-acetyltransferase [Halobacillus massiliensis]
MNQLFLDRIGFSNKGKITFKDLETILKKAAKTIPFENLRIIKKQTKPITKNNLINKLLIEKEGGVCYEINPLLYYFLKENQFNVYMVKAAVEGSETGKTHVALLLNSEARVYLLDAGFGGNLPLIPVPLTGEKVATESGEFQIKSVKSDGLLSLRVKLKSKDEQWRTGYTFYPEDIITDVSELNEMQHIITEHEASPFNKHPLMTRFTDNGTLTLTNTSFTIWADEEVQKKEINTKNFHQLANKYFQTQREV